MSSDNFYRFHCSVIGQQTYIAGCFRIHNHIKQKTDAGRWPECANALRGCSCEAKKMQAEELAAFRPIYYVDRDDVGPGAQSRIEQGRAERGEDERNIHHDLLAGLNREPYVAPPVAYTLSKPATPAKTRSPGRQVVEPPAPPAPRTSAFDSFDLGALITEEVRSLGAAK